MILGTNSRKKYLTNSGIYARYCTTANVQDLVLSSFGVALTKFSFYALGYDSMHF